MSKMKIAITIDQELVGEVDRLVQENTFSNRSQAIQEAVLEKITRLKQTRLMAECFKLDPGQEKEIAEEGLSLELDQWPEY